MEYIEKRLRLDFLTNASENGTVDVSAQTPELSL